ncbi:MAG: Gfo/Idh/MocA family oxidoreductase [Dehalococcoidia bacterium]|nr:Gfo/Idh/MocA family oxidoreductase [Dehalococcoidia bacterium]
MTSEIKPLKLGVIGVGVGAAEMLPPMERASYIELFAGADIDPDVRERFKSRYPNARVYASAEELVSDPDVEAVWISTPNRFHAPMTILAANHGKHVVVEKPMALDMKQAEEMVEACEKNGVKLVAGHTQSFQPHVRLMRQIVASGELGQLGAVNAIAYTDWVIRPRTADELDPNQGGGLVYRQTPHQIDSIRLIGGGKVRSVRGAYGQWMKYRSIPGYYSVFLEFENGVTGVAIHNGYGYFVASELVPWGDANTRYTPTERNEIRKAMAAGTRPEDAEKLSLRIGGEAEQAIFRSARGPENWKPNDLGIVIVSCEFGELRQGPEGLYKYTDDGLVELMVDSDPLHRDQELEELYNAVRLGRPVFHSGAWGMATLEVGLAINESTKTHKDIVLSHQIEMPSEYDQEYKVEVLSEKRIY